MIPEARVNTWESTFHKVLENILPTVCEFARSLLQRSDVSFPPIQSAFLRFVTVA